MEWTLEQEPPSARGLGDAAARQAGALITHRFPLEQARQAYALLDQHPEEAIQVLFTYGEYGAS